MNIIYIILFFYACFISSDIIYLYRDNVLDIKKNFALKNLLCVIFKSLIYVSLMIGIFLLIKKFNLANNNFDLYIFSFIFSVFVCGFLIIKRILLKNKKAKFAFWMYDIFVAIVIYVVSFVFGLLLLITNKYLEFQDMPYNIHQENTIYFEEFIGLNGNNKQNYISFYYLENDRFVYDEIITDVDDIVDVVYVKNGFKIEIFNYSKKLHIFEDYAFEKDYMYYKLYIPKEKFKYYLANPTE